MNPEEMEEKIINLSVEFASFKHGAINSLINIDNTNKEMAQTFVMLNNNLKTIIEKLHNETEARLTSCGIHKKEFIQESSKYIDDAIKYRMTIPSTVLGLLILIIQIWSITHRG